MTNAESVSDYPSVEHQDEHRDVPANSDDKPASQTSSASPSGRKEGHLTVSPLTRKIILFNLLGLALLMSGLLLLDPAHSLLETERKQSLARQASIYALHLNKAEAQTPLLENPQDVLGNAAVQLGLQKGESVPIAHSSGDIISQITGTSVSMANNQLDTPTPIINVLNVIVRTFQTIIGVNAEQLPNLEEWVRLATTSGGQAQADTSFDVKIWKISTEPKQFMAAKPLDNSDYSVLMISSADEFKQMINVANERYLQFFILAILVSTTLSLVLASTIAKPLNDLATAGELGREKNKKDLSPSRVRIPDLTGRPDEIGRLSAALRGMVTALYDRIDSNEQFAADVAHELKNPLASLRSAVGTLRRAHRDDHREKLLDVIEHDVRRLDRLVSDISNASRLDSELVKEEQEEFDLLALVRSLSKYLSEDAQAKGIEFISDVPEHSIFIQGLEARLAQVFVNLITNAISFCNEDDAIRVWVRKRENRILVVVEDTGPGIPEDALLRVFERVYSQRPVSDFGNNSGLGLAISKQIIEAHSGVIWAENIREHMLTRCPLHLAHDLSLDCPCKQKAAYA